MRSTIHKQNSLIARYCLAAVVLLALLGPLAGESRGDFVLHNDEQLTVSVHHSEGTLCDMSRAFLLSIGSLARLYTYGLSNVDISAGSVGNLYARNSSRVDISSIGSVGNLVASDSSAVNTSGGSLYYLEAEGSSTVDISGIGSVTNLSANNSSIVNISGGSVDALSASDSSTVNISGGRVRDRFEASDSSTVNISGGSLSGDLSASGSIVLTFYGRNFGVYGGLVFEGDYVLGTGLLAGEWFNGTPWAVNITEHTPSATILVISDSEPKPVCVKYPAMDFNGDCKVDFSDLAVFLTHWLDCNLDPPSACWE